MKRIPPIPPCTPREAILAGSTCASRERTHKLSLVETPEQSPPVSNGADRWMPVRPQQHAHRDVACVVVLIRIRVMPMLVEVLARHVWERNVLCGGGGHQRANSRRETGSALAISQRTRISVDMADGHGLIGMGLWRHGAHDAMAMEEMHAQYGDTRAVHDAHARWSAESRRLCNESAGTHLHAGITIRD